MRSGRSGFSRRIRPALACAGVLVLAVFAEDPPGKAEQFQQKWDAAHKIAAKELVQLAMFAKNRKLHEVALKDYEAAAEADPANAEAQKGAGRKLEGTAWVPDPKSTIKRKNEGKDDEIERQMAGYKEKRKPAIAKIVKELDAAGDFATKNTLDEEAEKTWKRILDFDPDHEKSRKNLGYEKQDGRWVPPSDVKKRNDGKKKIADSTEGEWVDEKTEVENITGWQLVKRRSRHFFISGKYTDAEIRELVKVAEGTRKAFLEAFAQPEDAYADPIEFLMLVDKEDHEIFIDQCTDMEPHKKANYKNYGGYMKYEPKFSEAFQGGGDFDYMKDICCHDTVHQLFYQHTRISDMPAWLGEGIAYWFTDRMLKSAETHCIDFALSGGGSGKSWDNVLDWRGHVKEMIQTGGDPDLKEIMEGPLNSLTAKKGCKAWSVVDYMMTARKKEFFEFCVQLADDAKDEDALKAAFGVSGYKEFNDKWKEWVLATY